MKSLIIVFAALLVIIAFPLLFDSIDDARVDHFTQNVAGLTTGAGGYTSNATLSRALYDDDAANVVSVTSNTTADSPSADSYNSVSRLLIIGGLVASTTRTISITYEIDSTVLDDYVGMGVFLTLFIWLVVFIVLGLLVGAVYAFFQT